MLNYPINILNQKELNVLFKMFQIKNNDANKLEKKLSKLLLPAGGLLQKGYSYGDFLDKIADKRKISLTEFKTISEKEIFLFKKIYEQTFNSLPVEEQEKLKAQLITEAEKNGLDKSQIASISALASIGAAQLSGFGIYLLASSTVGAITGLVGVTLPFAFYTTMSSVISFAIGPLGIILASIPLYKSLKNVKSLDDLQHKGKEFLEGFKVLFKGNYQAGETLVSYFASLRILKQEECNALINDYEKEISIYDENLVLLNEQYKAQTNKKQSLEQELNTLQQAINAVKQSINEKQNKISQAKFKQAKQSDIKRKLLK